MIELCDYIYSRYPNIQSKAKYWQILSLLDRNADKIITIKKDGKFMGTALYARISDETMDKIKSRTYDVSKPEDINMILSGNGNNIFFLYLLADGTRTILQGLKQVIKKEHPDNVCWNSIDMTKLNIFKVKEKILCQYQ